MMQVLHLIKPRVNLMVEMEMGMVEIETAAKVAEENFPFPTFKYPCSLYCTSNQNLHIQEHQDVVSGYNDLVS